MCVEGDRERRTAGAHDLSISGTYTHPRTHKYGGEGAAYSYRHDHTNRRAGGSRSEITRSESTTVQSEAEVKSQEVRSQQSKSDAPPRTRVPRHSKRT